jgi:hypothetical protein
MPDARVSPGAGAAAGAAPAAVARRGLSLAAAPVFAGMALLSARAGDTAPLACLHGASALGGMTAMYALMAIFHLPPWLRLWAAPG